MLANAVMMDSDASFASMGVACFIGRHWNEGCFDVSEQLIQYRTLQKSSALCALILMQRWQLELRAFYSPWDSSLQAASDKNKRRHQRNESTTIKGTKSPVHFLPHIDHSLRDGIYG
jgi:hypothetical protein